MEWKLCVIKQSCSSSSYSAHLTTDINMVRWEILAFLGRSESRQVGQVVPVSKLLLAREDFGQRERCQEEEENWSCQPQRFLLFPGLQEKKQMLEIIDWGFGQGGVWLYFLQDSGALPGVFHHQVKCFYKMSAEDICTAGSWKSKLD